jgi:menaquinol-cytochrome c reductase iron-sulfur subunit
MGETEGLARRGFFVRATQVLGALITGGLTLPALAYLFRGPNTIHPGGWVDATDVTRLKPRIPEEISFRRVRKDGWNLISEKSTAWVVKLTDTEVVAFTPQCTHLGCAYHYEAEKGEFLCPCHTSNFSIEGKVLTGPAPRPLDRYPVQLQGSRLLIGSIEAAPKKKDA